MPITSKNSKSIVRRAVSRRETTTELSTESPPPVHQRE